MHNTALVSIIVPIYCTEVYLPECIESLCHQTYPHIQIVLVDDQSPDQCPAICDRYAQQDERIVVIHQKNSGVSGARNTGLRYASGEYIMFVDSDDTLNPDAVRILLQDAYDYEADIVWAPQNCAVETNAVYNIYRNQDALALSLDGTHNINAVWGKLFRATFIQNLRFVDGKNINEDGFFMFQCYMRAPVFVRHAISIYNYNIRPDSCSRQVFSDKYLAMLYFCDRKKALIAEHYPHYIEKAYNMEVRTNLQLLDLLCTASKKQYKDLQSECISTVRRLRGYHIPINDHHRKLAWIVTHGLYPIYKLAFRIKYHR